MNAGEVDVVLRDGSTARVRETSPDDVDALASLLSALSPQARWLRFLGFGVDARAAADKLLHSGRGLVALAGADAGVVGHACLVPEGDGRAEVAFAVADAWRGHGIGTILLGRLADLAHDIGVTTLTAVVHPSNHRMLQVFRDSGFPIDVRSEPGALVVELPAQLGPKARARFEERDDAAAEAAFRHVLAPSSIAVIGASRHEDTIGGAVIRNLVAAGFTGALYPVNRHARHVAGRRAYRSLADVPGVVELAVVVVPAASVPGVARDCASQGVRALVVLSAGFGEVGPDGLARQRELLAIVARRGCVWSAQTALGCSTPIQRSG